LKSIESRRPSIGRRIAKIFISLVIIVAVLSLAVLVAFPPFIMGPMLNKHVDFKTIYKARDFDLVANELTLETSDGYSISAFEVQAENPRGVLIFISGLHNPSVTAFFGHAKAFKDLGYSSILFDMRGHGKSSGKGIGLGYLETRDTQAVVDYIKAQPEYARLPIIAYGASMGGAVAINSAGVIPEISGVISIASFSSWEDVFAEGMEAKELPPVLITVVKPFVKLYSILKFGWGSRNIYPERQIANIGDRPIFLLHSIFDEELDYENFKRLVESAPSHTRTWTRIGRDHFFVTRFLNPEQDQEYMRRVTAFLNDNF